MAVLGFAFVLELFIYIAILRRPPRPEPGEKFDLIAVFGGDPARAQLAIQQCQVGRAGALVISDTSSSDLENYFHSYGFPGEAKVFLEPYARTTDENARMVSKIIRAQGFKRVLLVTSWYHQPRSYLLLRMSLLGTEVYTRMLSTEDPPSDFYRTPEFRLELVKFWGSLARWTKSILRKKGLIPGEETLAVD